MWWIIGIVIIVFVALCWKYDNPQGEIQECHFWDVVDVEKCIFHKEGHRCHNPQRFWEHCNPRPIERWGEPVPSTCSECGSPTMESYKEVYDCAGYFTSKEAFKKELASYGR